MRRKSGRTYIRHKFLKWIFQTQNHFFREKLFAEQNDIQKSSKQNKYFHWAKMHCFLKVLTFYKEISE